MSNCRSWLKYSDFIVSSFTLSSGTCACPAIVTRASSAVMIAFLFIVLFVFEDFFEFLGQSLATQVGGYDFALRIDKEIGGNSGDAVDGGEF